MSSGANINAGGATVYLNLATNARNANVAAAIRNELHQVQNLEPQAPRGLHRPCPWLNLQSIGRHRERGPTP